jgi:hypothetical protein
MTREAAGQNRLELRYILLLLLVGQKWSSNRFKMIAKPLNIPKTVVVRILKEDLWKRKLRARFFHNPWPEQREDRVTSCQDIIAMAKTDKIFSNKIVTGDYTWCFAYDPETKRKISEWVGEISTPPKNLKFQRSRIKNMLIIFSTLKA